jgi:hypothetical protein
MDDDDPQLGLYLPLEAWALVLAQAHLQLHPNTTYPIVIALVAEAMHGVLPAVVDELMVLHFWHHDGERLHG